MPTVAVMNPVDVDRPSGRRRSVADPGAVFTLCALIAMAACGGGSPSAPTPPAPPAATWSLSGTIRNEMNNEPLVGARVEILDGADQGRSATTGQDGRYLFASVRAGQFSIRAAAEGFDVQSRVVTLGADLVVDFVMRRPAPPGTGTAGILVQALSDAQVPGGTLDVSGLGVFTTEADGTFRIAAAAPEEIRSVTITSAGTVERVTQLRIPGPDARLTLIPSSFDLPAFDQMFRLSGRLQRWSAPPRLTVQTRVLQFTNVGSANYAAVDETMSDAEANALVADLAWGLPLLSASHFPAYGEERRETAAAGESVRVTRTGEIVVARYAGLQAATTYWGYGRWATDGDGTVVGGIVMLDRDFDASGSQFRRSLRVHELGHAMGYTHVTTRASVMNSSARLEPNEFDLQAARLAFQRPPGNRSPDRDPDAFTSNIQVGGAPVTWRGSH